MSNPNMQYKSLPEPVTLVEDEIELVGVSYSLGEHHTGQTDAYADIMPVVSPNYAVFAPNQFLMAIPDFVWLKILIPLMGPDVLGAARSICGFFDRLHIEFAKKGVLQVSENYSLQRCVHYIQTLHDSEYEPAESTFKINVCAGRHTMDIEDWRAVIEVQLIAQGAVSIENQVLIFNDIKLTLRNIEFKNGFSVVNKDTVVHAHGCTFSNSDGHGADVRFGGALRAFHCTFSNCSRNGLVLKGSRPVSNAFSEVADEEMRRRPVSNRAVLHLSSFVGFNCKFNRNGENGINIDSLTNFYLNGKDCELANNALKGMQAGRRTIFGGCIRLGTDVPLGFSKLNGNPDCETHQIQEVNALLQLLE